MVSLRALIAILLTIVATTIAVTAYAMQSTAHEYRESAHQRTTVAVGEELWSCYVSNNSTKAVLCDKKVTEQTIFGESYLCYEDKLISQRIMCDLKK
jgi:hypothetical protein